MLQTTILENVGIIPCSILDSLPFPSRKRVAFRVIYSFIVSGSIEQKMRKRIEVLWRQ